MELLTGTRVAVMAKGHKRSIGPAAKACKGRKAGAFRACVRRVMHGGKA